MEIPSIWLERLGAWKSSKLSAEVFCEEKEFSVHSLRKWRGRQLDAERRAAPRTESVALGRVRVVSPRLRVSNDRLGSTGIWIEVGTLRVRVEHGFDRSTLAAVLGVVSSTSTSEAAP